MTLYALASGRIAGGVIGPDGKPLHLAFVNLYLASRYKDGKARSFKRQSQENETGV